MADMLAHYIVNDLFEWFREERQNRFEDRWRRNYDAFRGRYNSSYLNKWKATEGNQWRSRIFVKLTKAKVYAGFNQVVGTAGQLGGMPWGLEASTKPGHGQMQLPEEVMEQRADAMRRQIKDDFQDGRASEQWQHGVLEGALYGFSWLRGPVLRKERRAVTHMGPQGFALHTEDIEIPKVELPGLWNVFWDLECHDHQQGKGVVIRDMMTVGKFLDLQESPGFDRAAIRRIADRYKDDEGGGTLDESEGPVPEEFLNRRQVVPVYRFWGRVPRKLMTGDNAIDDSDDGREVEIQCVCAGKDAPEVIYRPQKAILPYRPLYLFQWEKMPGEMNATGIPENMDDSQSIINGLTRALLDSKALSSNVMGGVRGDMLSPGQNRLFYPGKMFELEMGVEDVREALQFFSPPDATRGMEQTINWFRDWCDEETGITRMMSVQESAPNRTAFELSKIAEGGNKLLGGIIRNNDDGHIEPIVRGFYHFHMLSNPDENLKGDFTPVASGFQSYIDKEVKGQQIAQVIQFVLSAEALQSEAKIDKLFEDWVKTTDIDPDRVLYSDEERQAIQIQQQQQPPPPELVKDQAEAQEAQAQAAEAGAKTEQAGIDVEKAKVDLMKSRLELAMMGQQARNPQPAGDGRQ